MKPLRECSYYMDKHKFREAAYRMESSDPVYALAQWCCMTVEDVGRSEVLLTYRAWPKRAKSHV